MQWQGKGHSSIAKHSWLDGVSNPGPLGPLSFLGLLSPQLGSRTSKGATPSLRLWPVQGVGFSGSLRSRALTPGSKGFWMSWGSGREGQAWAELTCPASVLHPHPTGLGARGPLVPRSPDTLRAPALLWGCLRRLFRQHLLVQAELREGQKQHKTKLGPARPLLHRSALHCPRAREEGTGQDHYSGIWAWRLSSAGTQAGGLVTSSASWRAERGDSSEGHFRT